jgi:hypothetical protein
MLKKKIIGSLMLVVVLDFLFPFTALSKGGYLEVIVVPKAHIFADGNPMTLKVAGKAKFMMDTGIHTVSAELDGYHMESKTVDVLTGKKYKVVLSLLKRGQDRDTMADISAGKANIGVDRDRVDWIVKRIGGKEADFTNAVPSHAV